MNKDRYIIIRHLERSGRDNPLWPIILTPKGSWISSRRRRTDIDRFGLVADSKRDLIPALNAVVTDVLRSSSIPLAVDIGEDGVIKVMCIYGGSKTVHVFKITIL